MMRWKMLAPLKYLSIFRRTPKLTLTNCEVSLMLTWSENCFLIGGTEENQNPTFTVTDTNFYVPVCNFINSK